MTALNMPRLKVWPLHPWLNKSIIYCRPVWLFRQPEDRLIWKMLRQQSVREATWNTKAATSAPLSNHTVGAWALRWGAEYFLSPLKFIHGTIHNNIYISVSIHKRSMTSLRQRRYQSKNYIALSNRAMAHIKLKEFFRAEVRVVLNLLWIIWFLQEIYVMMNASLPVVLNLNSVGLFLCVGYRAYTCEVPPT